MRGKRSVALVLCLVMVLALLPMNVALAAPLTPNDYKINGQAVTPSITLYEIKGIVYIPLYTDVMNVVNIQSDGSGKLVLTNITPATDINGDYQYSASQILFIEAGINPDLAVGPHPAKILVYEADETEPVELSFTVHKTTAPASTSKDDDKPETPTYPEGLTSILMLSPTDANGQSVASPKGNYGDRVTVRVPIFNRGGIGSRATRILVTPVLSATLDSFPFDVEAVDYTRGLDEMRPGEIREVAYSLKLSKEVTSGVKEVKFNAVYFNTEKQAYETATFSVFVTVVKGKTPPKTGTEGEELTSAPKVIIEGYTVKPAKEEDGDKLYAGEQFELTMRFRNTANEAVQNVQITIDNEAGVILPANSGSNTFYIDRIGAGDVVERTMQMQTVPEIEPKSHKLAVKMGYESAKTLKAYDVPADISLSVKQRIRMRVDDPMMETEAMLGNAVYVSLNIYNMGNSTVRNVLVNVEGEGLKLEENYYGGNLSSGSSTSADFGIVPSVAGEIQGKIVITYEDAMAEVFREEKPFTLNVTDGGGDMGMMIDPETGLPIDMGDMGAMPGMSEGMVQEGGMPLWLIIALAVVAAGVVVGVILVVRKSRRKRFLEGK